MNICLLENWEFNHKLAPPLLTHTKLETLSSKSVENMKVTGIQKSQFLNSSELREIWNIAQATIKKLQYSISFMNCKKIEESSFCELGKSLKYSLRPTFKNPNFESMDEFKNAMSQFKCFC